MGYIVKPVSLGEAARMQSIPEHVARFLSSHIESVEQLEVLLLLQRSKERSWTAIEVAAELRTATTSAAARLADLCSRGVLRAATGDVPAYTYAAPSDDLDRTILDLARTYAERRVSVITAIYAPPAPADPLEQFSNAFRIRGKGG